MPAHLHLYMTSLAMSTSFPNCPGNCHDGLTLGSTKKKGKACKPMMFQSKNPGRRQMEIEAHLPTAINRSEMNNNKTIGVLCMTFIAIQQYFRIRSVKYTQV